MVGEMKKRLQRRGARRGFTLVELLIVIIIIGILAGAMMLVAGTSRDSAEASKIISDLRNMKAAALMWISENPGVAGKEGTGITRSWEGLGTTQDRLNELNKYLDRPLDRNAPDFPYKFIVQEFEDGDGNLLGEAWLLGYKTEGLRAGVKSNLEKQAASAGLYGGTDTALKETSEWPPSTDALYKTSDNDEYVYVIVQ